MEPVVSKEPVTAGQEPGKDDHLALKAALWAIEQEKQAGGMKVVRGHPSPYSTRSAAEKFGASRSAVARHMRTLREGKSDASPGKKRGRPAKLTPSEDRLLVSFVKSVQKTGVPCERVQVKSFVNEMMALSIPPRKPMSKKWLSKWLQGHPEVSVGSYDASASFAAKTAMSARRWFDQTMEQNVNQNNGAYRPMRFTAVEIQRPTAVISKGQGQQLDQPVSVRQDAQIICTDVDADDSEDVGEA